MKGVKIMDTFDRRAEQKRAINAILIAIFMSIVILAGLMAQKVHQTSAIRVATSSLVKFGPLNLIRIKKVPLQTGGFQAQISLLPHLVIYFGLWLLAACIVFAVTKFKHSSKPLSANK